MTITLLSSKSALHREMETRKTEWQTQFEEAKIREAELKETLREFHLKEERNKKMKQCEERETQALQRGAEEEREKHRVEVEEYREQVRQHAYTIVAMETRINKAQQSEERWREIEVERDSLKDQLKGEHSLFFINTTKNIHNFIETHLK